MKSRDAWLVSAAELASAGVGIMLGAPYVVAGGVLAAGITGIGALMEEKKIFKQREMFRACDLCLAKNKGETIVYPSIISSSDRHMLISLPWGMALKDVISKHGFMENYFGGKVLIEETPQKKILIRLLDPSSSEQDRWLDIFNQIGAVGNSGEYPKLTHSEINKIGEKAEFSLPSGIIVSDFKAKQEKLESALQCKVDILEEKYKMIIQTMTREFKKLYKIDFKEKVLPDMRFIIGVGRDGEPLVMDLGGNEFSTLVCGASGSGKSVFLNCLMAQFILKDVEIRAIDLKAVEFKIFKQYKNMSRYATSRNEAIPILENTYDLMQERYQILEASSCKSYADYNMRFGNKMPPVLLIIDEFSVLMNGEKSKSNVFLFELLSRARAANILVIICTQTPRAKILDTTIRCNIKNTVCFSVETDADSEVALGQRGNYRAAKELNDPGRGFLKSRGKLIEFQSYFLEDHEIEKQIDEKMSKTTMPTDNEEDEEDGFINKIIPIPMQRQINNHKKQQQDQESDVESLLGKIDNLE